MRIITVLLYLDLLLFGRSALILALECVSNAMVDIFLCLRIDAGKSFVVYLTLGPFDPPGLLGFLGFGFLLFIFLGPGILLVEVGVLPSVIVSA